MKNLKNSVISFASIALFVLVFSMNGYAQKAEFGLRFMPTFSKFDLQTSSGGSVKGEVKLGYGIGGLLGFNFNKNVGAQVEVIYSSLSQKYTENNVDREVNLKYVNIPLLLSLNTGKTKMINLNIVAGPQIGVSVGSSLSSSGNTSSDSTTAVLSVKKGDLGVAYGAGVDFGLNPARTIRLSVGYRGVLGLFDVSDNNQNLTTDAYYILDRSHIKTNAIYMGLSILF
jgi:hypothetical protein